jgi:hypothetical protein
MPSCSMAGDRRGLDIKPEIPPLLPPLEFGIQPVDLETDDWNPSHIRGTVAYEGRLYHLTMEPAFRSVSPRDAMCLTDLTKWQFHRSNLQQETMSDPSPLALETKARRLILQTLLGFGPGNAISAGKVWEQLIGTHGTAALPQTAEVWRFRQAFCDAWHSVAQIIKS